MLAKRKEILLKINPAVFLNLIPRKTFYECGYDHLRSFIFSTSMFSEGKIIRCTVKSHKSFSCVHRWGGGLAKNKILPIKSAIKYQANELVGTVYYFESDKLMVV